MYNVLLGLIGKHVVDFLLVIIELFSGRRLRRGLGSWEGVFREGAVRPPPTTTTTTTIIIKFFNTRSSASTERPCCILFKLWQKI